ncbi:MAG: PhoH family protein [Verrucomicrobiae bacterium]|nr:PhoH family protein [Verrucomicrobiae bacterium]
MPETTLHFENPRALQLLYANNPANLQQLEEKLDLKLTTREGWIKLKGKTPQIEKAKHLFESLHAAREHGIPIRQHEFQYALNLINQGKGEQLEKLYHQPIALSPKNPPIVPKTLGQSRYLDLIRQCDVTLGIGPAGTGKTYLAVAMAVAALKANQVHRIILTRPAVEAGESLGFLPGDLKEKLLPYLRPLYDALNDMLEPEEVERYIERNTIEIAPLAYMRGRTLANAFIILDEGQNATTEQMFMFLTRLGPDSKCVVTGDPTQIDLPRARKSGLIEAVEALSNTPGIGLHAFNETDVIRHPIVQKIINAYRSHRGEKNTPLNF